MAPVPSCLRRSASALVSGSPAFKRGSVALTTASTPVIIQRRCLSTTTTSRSPVSFRNGLSIITASSVSSKLRYQSLHRAQSLRWKSDEAEGSSLRQWGFEDINSALPSDPSTSTSPTHTPLILIDVREPAELTATGIIPSALNVPLASQPDALYLTADEFETRFGFPKPGADADQKDGAMVFYCKAGVRARAAAQLAVQAGYDPARVGVYMGSWLDWERRGGRVEKWEGEEH